MVVASSNKTHMICVVCGKGFSSIYDEDLKLFPVYHSAQNSSLPCEGHFFKALVSIYECLHGQESTIQFSELLTQVDWGEVQLRKQMLSWCLNQGYLAVDSFNRFLVPPVIEDITKDLFCAVNL
ncbi:hypothetical protein GF373_12930, partial [bacterium]|nr:hypothetical protein [bacterium]